MSALGDNKQMWWQENFISNITYSGKILGKHELLCRWKTQLKESIGIQVYSLTLKMVTVEIVHFPNFQDFVRTLW